MVRRVATELKTGFTGVVLVASLARLRASMAVFNAGVTFPRLFCRLELSVMVETQGSCEEAVRDVEEGCEEEPERQSMWAPIPLSRFTGSLRSVKRTVAM